MKQIQLSKFTISMFFFLFGILIYAQDTIPLLQDSLKIKQKFGLRLGLDISRPIIQTIQNQDLGVEITGDYRVANNWYVATEFGYESEPGKEDYLTFHTKGSYAKLGFNYNTYENWKGKNHEVYIGLRYGYSFFEQKLISYTILDTNNYFGPTTITPNTVYGGLSAHWGELHLGLKVEVLNNLFLTSAIQFKKVIKNNEPLDFSNLYVPGFGKVLLNNNGVSFNYTLAYLIPIKKK